MAGFVSPNELMEEGKEAVLVGREPENKEDWINLVYFWTHRVAKEVQPSAIQCLCKILDVPLSPEDIGIVCAYRKNAI